MHFAAMPNEHAQKGTVRGVVTEALPDTLFRVAVEGDEALLCYLSGKMRINRIRVLIGDRVELETSSYGGKGRIIKRL
ncbi:MAG: translation initiation factor IF-1 [Parcubacteria group bacterium Greene0416_79]|nr:MAG: translation initiation factor IF-1 [Parcubacteria group bacterium Greene0416_79]